MAKRILPYRDYSEHDVVNLFSLHVNYDKDNPENSDNRTEWVEAVNGKWDSGVVVKVSAGTLPGDLPGGLSKHDSGEVLRNYLGASPTSAHIGYNAYPYNGMTVAPAEAGDAAIGITLRETLAYDENGEKLLYYKQKLDEAQAVLPGQTVPVLTRGLVLLDESAFDAVPTTVGAKLYLAAGGKFSANTSNWDHDGDGGTAEVADTRSFGTVLALGNETKDSDVDPDGRKKVLCRISF